MFDCFKPLNNDKIEKDSHSNVTVTFKLPGNYWSIGQNERGITFLNQAETLLK